MRLWRRRFKPIPLTEQTVVWEDDGGWLVTLTSGVQLRVFADAHVESANSLIFELFLVGQPGKSRRMLIIPKDSVEELISFQEPE